MGKLWSYPEGRLAMQNKEPDFGSPLKILLSPRLCGSLKLRDLSLVSWRAKGGGGWVHEGLKVVICGEGCEW